MSLKAIAWAWDQPAKPATAKLVLLCLADCYNGETGRCFPSIPYIAQQTGLDRKSVPPAIRALEEAGYITAERVAGKSTTYRLHTDQARNRAGPEIGPTPGPKLGRHQARNRAPNQEGTGKEPVVIRADGEAPPDATPAGPRKLPADWWPSEELVERIDRLGYRVKDPVQLITEFVDYWHHRGTRRKDWDRTLINRFKKQSEFEARQGGQHGQTNSTQLLADDLAKALAD